jgi:hypothetical protein
MTQRHRYGARSIAIDDGQIGMAKTGSTDPHEDLIPAGWRELQFFDRKRFAQRKRGRDG